MTPLKTLLPGAAAALVLAACTTPLAASIHAGRDPSVILVCPGGASDDFCTALAGAVRAEDPSRDVALTSRVQRTAPDTAVLTFVPAERARDRLSGHLVWTDGRGDVRRGPMLALQVMDAELTGPMFRSFASQLLRYSALPL